MSNVGRNIAAVTANSTTTVESTNGAPIGVWSQVKRGKATATDGANAHYGNTSPQSRAGVDSTMFGNVTMSAFINNRAVGVFGVSANQMLTGTVTNSGQGNIAFAVVTSPGTGYTANAVVTLTARQGSIGLAVVNAHANTTGKIDLLNIQTNALQTAPPVVAIAAPAATTFNANTGVTGGTPTTGANDCITIASAGFFVANDGVTYSVAAGNTAVVPLVSGTRYFIQFANATVVALAATVGGARIQLTPSTVSETGHTLRGDTATGYVDIAGTMAIPHSGWVLRREGTGGRAGRVTYEVLDASGSVGAQTAPYGTPATVSTNPSNLFPG